HEVVTKMNSSRLIGDVIENDHVLAHALQAKPLNYFRPATGQIDDKSAQLITNTGVDYIVLYDVSSQDWDLSITAKEVYDNVMDLTAPGCIILIHVLDESHTLTILPSIIETLHNKGYSLKRVSEMLEEYEIEKEVY